MDVAERHCRARSRPAGDAAGECLHHVAGGLNEPRAGHVRARIESVARAEVCVRVVEADDEVIRAEVQAARSGSIVDQEVREGVQQAGAQIEYAAGIDLHRAAAPQDAAGKSERAAVGFDQPVIRRARGDAAKAADRAAGLVDERRRVERPAAELQKRSDGSGRAVGDGVGRGIVAVAEHLERTVIRREAGFDLRRADLDHRTRAVQLDHGAGRDGDDVAALNRKHRAAAAGDRAISPAGEHARHVISQHGAGVHRQRAEVERFEGAVVGKVTARISSKKKRASIRCSHNAGCGVDKGICQIGGIDRQRPAQDVRIHRALVGKDALVIAQVAFSLNRACVRQPEGTLQLRVAAADRAA